MRLSQFLESKMAHRPASKSIKEAEQVRLRNFAQELLTTKSPPLKPGYGTSFLASLGEMVNPPKVRYYLDIYANMIAPKHGIVRADVISVEKAGDSVVIEMEILADSGHVARGSVNILWRDKIFTTEAIVER